MQPATPCWRAYGTGDGCWQTSGLLLDDARLRQWDARKNAVMRDAMCAKFSQHEPLRAMLLATRQAELWHGTGRGQPPVRIGDLETIRDTLSR
jgi:hypothetical protein